MDPVVVPGGLPWPGHSGVNCGSRLGCGSATTHAFHFRYIVKFIGETELVLCLPLVYKQILGFTYLSLYLSLLLTSKARIPKERYVFVCSGK